MPTAHVRPHRACRPLSRDEPLAVDTPSVELDLLAPSAWSAIGAAGGAVLGALIGHRATTAKARADKRIAEMQAETQRDIAAQQLAAQRELAERQAELQMSIEAAKRHSERLEEAYRPMMRWLDEIQATFEEVHEALFSDNQQDLARAMRIIDEWPFRTLRAPSYTAETGYLWSDAVWAKFGEFSGASVHWHSRASRAMFSHMTHETRVSTLGPGRAKRLEEGLRGRPHPRDIRGDVCMEQRKLVAKLDNVRAEVQREITVPSA
jgi:hypothetical protein